ncbi:hypothetical protein [Laspinema olomoucense]|uniref:Uncharacterized protein n=1 Tax=Laspinema olomoucense D3b TaxID=2953688 RepID=A0ABT2NAM5_9CYAN|nr:MULTISPECIES: hypothetical protein [unclassified Laspinema]MCT7971849.1 hypothetical protein [Laspinema sp. D3d]MCT7979751.1 hypothetical protein [Laspinema sp. D3b]MCT7991794.1 hypothetical protein [Laspinema sp. D3a]
MSHKSDIDQELREKQVEFLLGEENFDEEIENYEDDYFVKLQESCLSFLAKESFKVGQIVRWKNNMKNRKLPYKNQPAIVVAVLNEPIINNLEDSGSPYFRENLDIVLGILVNHNTFLTFYYDSRRFEMY